MTQDDCCRYKEEVTSVVSNLFNDLGELEVKHGAAKAELESQFKAKIADSIKT